MRQSVIYEIPSLYRENFRIHGYTFGQGEKALCVVGSLRGNEYQQIYTCSQLVKALKRAEQRGELCPMAMHVAFPYVDILRYGGQLPTGSAGDFRFCCPDADVINVFQIKVTE